MSLPGLDTPAVLVDPVGLMQYRLQHLITRRRSGHVVLAVMLLLLVASSTACSRSDSLAATATATTTTTPTPTPPPPTPTPTPVPLTNAAFPPPPARTVAPAAPPSGVKKMVIHRLHVDHYVEDTPVTNGEMQTPTDAQYGVGYYPYFKVKPGESGNAIFSAHETWQHMQGPFFSLHHARPGDDIYIQMTDGTEFRYQVMTYKRYDVNSIPMGEVVNPTNRPFGEAWITLITCGGRIVYDASGFGEYLDRDVVVAKMVK